PVDQLVQLLYVGGGRVLEAVPPSLFPMLDEIQVKLAGPADATLHEAELEAGVTPHHATQEHATGEGMVRLCEMADVVVSEIADGRSVGPAWAARVLGHRHA